LGFASGEGSMVARPGPMRGGIYMVNLDPTMGHEMRGRHPALVVSADSYNNKVGMALICPITSKRKGYPFEVVCDTKNVSGVILVDQIRALDWKVRKFERIDALSMVTFAEVQAKLMTLIE